MVDAQNELDGVKTSLDAVGDSAKETTKHVAEFAMGTGEAIGNLASKAAESTGSVKNSFTAMALSAEPFFNLLDKKREVFGKLGEDSKNSASSIKDSYGTLSPIFNAVGTAASALNVSLGAGVKKLNTTVATMVAAADRTRILEVNLLKTAASTGKLDEFITSTGSSFERISDRTATYTNLLTTTGQATNKTATAVSKFADELSKVPGALDTTAIDIGGTSMNMLTASIKLAAGTGMDYTDIISGLNNSFKLFNLQGEDALNYINKIAIGSQAMGVPLESVKKLTEETAKQFKFLGDNTGGAINVMSGFHGAMKDSGLGYETIQEMASGALQKIKEMDIAQQGVLSQQSGGPGGLQGAFQIQGELRDGKTVEVFARVEEALKKQMGSNIVSLDEAKGSQQAAAQMMRQVAFLTQGPTAITGDKDVATRIADAMAKGQLTGLKDILASPQENLTKSVERGTKFQEMQMSELTDIAIKLDQSLMVESLELRAMEKLAFGAESPMARQLKDQMSLGTQRGANIKTLTGDRTEGVSSTLESQLSESGDNMSKVLSSSADALLSAGKAIDDKTGGAIGKMIPGGMDALKKGFDQAKEMVFGAGLTKSGAPDEDERNSVLKPNRKNKLRFEGLTAPPTAASMAREGIGKQASVTESNRAQQPQPVELNINLTKEGEKITTETIKLLIDDGITKNNKHTVNLAYVPGE